ncbi:MAG: YceD family protein [Stellaceae bacterium]
MSPRSAEFSRLVSLAQLGTAAFCQQIVASAAEREALARRFDLLSLDRLTATVSLCRRDGGTILLDAAFEAAFTQSCVVTLEPVPGMVAQSFSLIYGPSGQTGAEIALDIDDTVFEPLDTDVIDIGEAVAQELSLALPEFPRDPEAVIDIAADEPADTPFAVLARRRDQQPDGMG